MHHEVQATKKIIFKDGNKRNCHPNNLLLETQCYVSNLNTAQIK
ncbi:HNH endonuclease [Escherichia albertii]|nr:HNH endonuclease [Escherichia albertii]WDC21930.1 HNH endonuclease [Escherichia albertii]WDC28241.1 HNH endonuclease [Escherichia albertii]